MSDNYLLMDAISYVDDTYLKKYFDMKEMLASKKKKRVGMIRRSASIAACLCLVVSMLFTALYFRKHQQSSVVKPLKDTIWASPEEDDNIEDYFKLSQTGTIIITASLEAAMERVKDEDSTLFAVLLTETGGKETSYIYDSFVKKLNAKEDYMETGIVFLTKSQIKSLECPGDLAIILSLAEKIDE